MAWSALRVAAAAALVAWAPATASAAVSYEEIRTTLLRSAYASLPRYPVDSAAFGTEDGPANRLLQASRRVLTDRRDLLPEGAAAKLVQANGICLLGEWRVDAASAYTGLYRRCSRARVVARLSVTMSDTTRAARRAFGLALKLFPGADPARPVQTRNLLLQDSVLGHADLPVSARVFDNDPDIGNLFVPLHLLGTGLRMQRDFERAEREAGGCGVDVTYRAVSALAEAPGQAPVAPHWVRMLPEFELEEGEREDFRAVLASALAAGRELRWRVQGADFGGAGKGSAVWHALGTLRVDAAVTSAACDTRLHFHHPTGGC